MTIINVLPASAAGSDIFAFAASFAASSSTLVPISDTVAQAIGTAGRIVVFQGTNFNSIFGATVTKIVLQSGELPIAEIKGFSVNLISAATAASTSAEALFALFGDIEFNGAAGPDIFTSAAGLDRLNGGEGKDLLKGGAGNDTIHGNGGNDTIDGGANNDLLFGDAGNDTFLVNSSSDRVREVAGEGVDTVIAASSYELFNVAEIEILKTSDANGTSNFSLKGNAFAQTIVGNAGDNLIDGRGGPDTLKGGKGNDTYHVDHKDAKVIEASGQGDNDRVISTVNFSLGGQFAEHLKLDGALAIFGTGNKLANEIIGSTAANDLKGLEGNDTINGGGGADTMAGGKNDDTYFVNVAGDKVVEKAGEGDNDVVNSTVTFSLGGQFAENLNLTGSGEINGTGNKLNNTIVGNSKKNFIDGGLGSDTLTGGSGTDRFVFKTALGADNVDTITDFFAPNDLIQIDNAVFKGLASGALAETAFKDLALGEKDISDRIIYNSATGELFFDRDGSKTVYGEIKFAVLSNLETITESDFSVI